MFGHFLKSFLPVSQQYCLTCSFQVLLDVWRIWASEAQFWGHFGPQISQNSGLWSFSQIFPTGCTSVLVYMSIWANFILFVVTSILELPILGPQIDHNSGNFIKHFPMVSHHSRFICLLGVLLCAFQLCAPKDLFLGLELRLQRSLLCHQASCIEKVTYYIITSSNENVFCITVPLWEESTRQRWIPLTKGRQYGPLMFLVLFVWTKCWTNSLLTSDSRQHNGHLTSL